MDFFRHLVDLPDGNRACVFSLTRKCLAHVCADNRGTGASPNRRDPVLEGSWALGGLARVQRQQSPPRLSVLEGLVRTI